MSSHAAINGRAGGSVKPKEVWQRSGQNQQITVDVKENDKL
jgi:hypothetical protein